MSTPSPNDDPKIDVWQNESGSWACSIDGGKPVHSHHRDDAIFWAGWWYGRRQLGSDVARLVDGGGAMRVRDVYDRTDAIPGRTQEPK